MSTAYKIVCFVFWIWDKCLIPKIKNFEAFLHFLNFFRVRWKRFNFIVTKPSSLNKNKLSQKSHEFVEYFLYILLSIWTFQILCVRVIYLFVFLSPISSKPYNVLYPLCLENKYILPKSIRKTYLPTSHGMLCVIYSMNNMNNVWVIPFWTIYISALFHIIVSVSTKYKMFLESL